MVLREARASFLLAVLFSVGGCSSRATSSETPSADPITITPTAEGYLFAERGDSVLLYRDRVVNPGREYARAHYVHPLFGPGGDIMTEDSPEDHPHQHGLYWAWHQIYIGDLRVGDGWTQEDISWDVFDVEVLEGKESSALRARVSWVSSRYLDDDGESVPFVDEMTMIRAYPTMDGRRQIDFTIELRALVDSVRIGGSEDEKGYGGFSARIRLPQDIRFIGPDGSVQPQITSVNAGGWLSMSATFGDRRAYGLAILQHPTTPGYPQPWILRDGESMQNVKWPGMSPVLIPRHEPVTLRYRLVIHEGHADSAVLERLHARYASVEN